MLADLRMRPATHDQNPISRTCCAGCASANLSSCGIALFFCGIGGFDDTAPRRDHRISG